MGKALANHLSQLLARAITPDTPREAVIRQLSISSYTAPEHVEAILAGTLDPDPVTLAAFARVLPVGEAELKFDLRHDQREAAAAAGSPPPPEQYFTIPGEDDDQAADAAQDAV